jgi:hypothetical protein
MSKYFLEKYMPTIAGMRVVRNAAGYKSFFGYAKERYK